MAIFRHVESGKRFLFIHIPRTAGRFVEHNLQAQGWEQDIDENIEFTRQENPTTVGMYDANDNLLAVAKLSRPIEKNDEKDITIRVRLDF